MRGVGVRLGAVCISLVLMTAVLAQVGAGVSSPVTAADPGPSVAYVAGNLVPPPGDRPNVARLQAGGANVTIIDDDRARATDYSGFDLIFLSTSVTLSKVGDHFRAVEIPMVTNEQYLLNDNAMGSKPIQKIDTKRIRIVDPGHELAAGLTGLVKITTAKTPLGYATSGPGAEVIGRYQGRDVYFAYRTDAEMIDGASAPARRVFFPGTYQTPPKANASYFDLFDAAIAWALTSDNRPPNANDDVGFTDEDAVLTGGPEFLPLAEFGSFGSAVGEFNVPSGVAVDSAGNIIVAERNNNRVQICSPTGECTSFGSSGSDVGQFVFPFGVAVDSAGNIVVGDRFNHRVQICSPAGDCTAFGSNGSGLDQFSFPRGVAVDDAGNIIIAGAGNDRVDICTPAGDCTAFGSLGAAPGQFSDPWGVAVNDDGNIVVADSANHRLQICTPAGDCTTFGTRGSDPGQFEFPATVAVDHDGNIVVADYENNRVQICTTTGTCTAIGEQGSEPGQFNNPFGVAVDAHGNIVVGDSSNHRVQILSRGVLVNDTDPDGDPLSVVTFDTVSTLGASVDVRFDGTYSYDPTGSTALQVLGAGDTIDDTFSYTIGDGRGGTAIATVTITVTGVDE